MNTHPSSFAWRFSAFTAGFLLIIMGALMLFIAYDKAAIVDESPHIIAGYSYDTKREYRLNPEHPPLIKALAALPLTLQNFNTPFDNPAWENEVNPQWLLGDQFLHTVGNNVVALTFWARVMPVLLTLLFGAFLFVWARKLYGVLGGLFAMVLFAFSPTFLAHGPLVTTDVGAAFAFFFAIFFLFRYLADQTGKNLLIAGIAFGIAQAMKFSLILIIPFFVAVVVGWVLFKDKPLNRFSVYTLRRIAVYLGKLILIGTIGLLVIYPIYQYTILEYPAEKQVADMRETLESSPYPLLADGVIKMAESGNPVLRSYAQFFLGHLMVFQRVQGGNTLYFLGEVSATAWISYFPVVFALKVPLALLLLMGISMVAVLIGGWRKIRIALAGVLGFGTRLKKKLKIIDSWLSEYFVEVMFALFIVFYWSISMAGNLNIGIRHVLPTFPFIYLLVTGIVVRWVRGNITFEGKNVFEVMRTMLRVVFRRWLKFSIVVVLLLWYAISSLSAFPNSLAYFNELAGGPKNGYKFVTDSNLDWGQDIRGLARYVEENNIESIRLSYFGPYAAQQYYLGEKVLPLDAENEEHRQGWIAVSATLLQEGRGVAAKGYDRSTTHFLWLNDYEPQAVIGHSIFIYNIP